ncbi:periplasmic solute-binding protein [Acetobacter aceti NRIC 0242]|uniref:ABC transporter substrate-binding protein n=1 Tax=Acetobacter aceti NBRC 14818 TaxID=887700 RepID=A0AB33IER5_ACEAC|nr:zinc ABC transporter substrate-binding protein [Acetobacter aceti]TCS32943.1 zinc/manganese transport system substrate-binding protein [Acetobacter aceti NBRC 14818]BCK76371.1 ABC transporter substrate-binding protein [Acetobacter aceti NBRC 14818]GAN56113.1 ABC transporter Mn2+/Zn2+ permease [Acetobacter aceti NBRC 14818]GBO81977.1 periplasmic solute-binding protein [Acetobacter aceti NRIC 0242]
MRFSLPSAAVFALCFGVLSSGVLSVSQASAESTDVTRIVAAENVWGDIAAQIGGPRVVVDSILSSPDLDPRRFEPSPAMVLKVKQADLIILNGAGFDSWMDRMAHSKSTIRIASIAGWRDDENPHFWFDPVVVDRVARDIAHQLRLDDSSGGLASFESDLARLQTRIVRLRQRIRETPIAVTDPLPGGLTEELGLVTENSAFLLAVMNGVEPEPAIVAQFENDLKNGQIKLLIYNPQTATSSVSHLLEVAKEAGVPCMPLTETLPPGLHWQDWMAQILDGIESHLLKPDLH